MAALIIGSPVSSTALAETTQVTAPDRIIVEPPSIDSIGLRLGATPQPQAPDPEARAATERLLELIAPKAAPAATPQSVQPSAAPEPTPVAAPAALPERPTEPQPIAAATPAAPTTTPPSAPGQSWPAMALRLRTTDADDGFAAPAPLVVQTNDDVAVASQPSAPAAPPPESAPPAAANIAEQPNLALQEPPTSVPELISVNAAATPIVVASADLQTLDIAPTPATTSAAPAEPQAAPAPSPVPPTKTDVAIAAPKDEPDALDTLSMAILSALEKNPEIQIAQAQRDDALFGVDETRAAMLPQVQLSASRGRERRSTEDRDEQSGLNMRTEIVISARQNLFDFGAAHDNLRSSASQAKGAEWAYRGQIDTVALRIASTFHQLVERQNTVRLAEENLAAHETILRTVQTQREFGMVTGADVSRIEARLNAARSELMDRKSTLDQAREDYRRLLDRAPGTVQPPEGVEAKIPPTVDDAIALLPQRNPNLMQARMLRDALDQQRSAQRASGLPRFDMELEGAARENVGGETGRAEEARALLSMRVPLFDGGARAAGVNRLTARIRQADFQVERARRDAEQAIRNDYVALQSAKGKVDAIDSEVAAAERLVSLYQEQFRSGTRTVFDVLDSQQTLYQALVKREANRTEMRLSSYRVLATLGSLVETVTAADNVPVRLFPAENASNVRGGRPASGAIVAR